MDFAPSLPYRSMIRLLLLPALLYAGPLFTQPHPDPATGIWYGKWAFALIPVVTGIVFQLLTLWITLTMVRECIRRKRYRRVSGFPFVGPLFISLGLWWSPSVIPAWVYLLPWGLEFLAGLLSVAVRRATRAGIETPAA